MLEKLRGVGAGDAGATLAVLITQLIGLPGCFLAVYLLPRLGRKQCLIGGAVGMLAVYLTLGILLSLPSLASLPPRLFHRLFHPPYPYFLY